MPFCTKCGTRLEDGDVFCGSCGAAAPLASVYNVEAKIEEKRETKPKPERKKPESETEDETNISPREARVKHCPACGEVISENETVCPSCGFMVRDVSTGSIALLSKKLELIENKRPEKKRKTDNDVISATDEKKISLIRSWPMPNSREDLIEFMAMASGNCIAPPKIGNDRIAAEDALAEAWKSKFDQAYVKAERLFGKADEFEQFRELKSEVQKRSLLARLRAWAPLLGALLFYILFMLFIPIYFRSL